jgi:hypothetical protein
MILRWSFSPLHRLGNIILELLAWTRNTLFYFINLCDKGWLDIDQYCKLLDAQLLLLEMQKDDAYTESWILLTTYSANVTSQILTDYLIIIKFIKIFILTNPDVPNRYHKKIKCILSSILNPSRVHTLSFWAPFCNILHPHPRLSRSIFTRYFQTESLPSLSVCIWGPSHPSAVVTKFS